jgi:hypothetical protein
MMVELTTTRLAELISKRRKCLAQLRELGARQSELIADGNMAALLRMLAAKHELIAALDALERELRPFHDQDPDGRTWPSAEARARCAADAEECKRLLAEVMAIEQAGERQMMVRRDGVASQLRSLSAAGKVHEAYEANR